MNRFCGSCGRPAETGARFCPGCGKPIADPQPQPAAFAASASAVSPAPAQPVLAAPVSTPAPAQPETQWHYAVSGKLQGQVSESALRAALQTLPPGTMVWHAGMPEWRTAEEVGIKAPDRPLAGATPAPVSVGPVPPSLHWALVLILSWVTFGIGGIFWSFKEAAFVKKIDPASKVVTLMLLTLIGVFAQMVIIIAAVASRSASTMALAGALLTILYLAVLVIALWTVFSMRSSIVRYYNTTEPVGLRLSGVMTFFFSMLYFQYHFSRIAEWKRTGHLN